MEVGSRVQVAGTNLRALDELEVVLLLMICLIEYVFQTRQMFLI